MQIKQKTKMKLYYIKLAHTIIWGILVAAILYILYAGIFDNVGMLSWFCIGLIFVEGIILLLCKGKCPLTLLDYRYANYDLLVCLNNFSN